MKLLDVQRMFGEAIASAEPVTQGAAAFVAAGARDPLTQLETYREQFWLRHVGCMAEDYPALQALVGEAAFHELCRRYFAAHPPSSFRLRDLGTDFAAFLERTSAPRLHVDLARVEWAFIEAFDAADAPPLDPASIASVAEDEWPKVVLRLHPSLQLLDLGYPAEDVRASFRRENKVFSPEPKANGLAVYRRELKLYVEPLEPLAHALLVRLGRGEALGPASEAVAASAGDPSAIEAKLGEWFARWTALGWIAEVKRP